MISSIHLFSISPLLNFVGAGNSMSSTSNEFSDDDFRVQDCVSLMISKNTENYTKSRVDRNSGWR